MKWKIKPKQIPLIALLLFSLVISLTQVYLWAFPVSTTVTILPNARYNPTQAQTSNPNNLFTVKNTIQPNNVTFQNGQLIITMAGTPYWIKIISGSNGNINIWKWFQDNTVVLEYLTTGTYISQLYVGNLGEPTVSGADLSSYNPTTKVVQFTTTPSSSQIIYFTWSSFAFTFHGAFNETTGLRIYNNTQVTAHYTDGTSPTTFNVNGTYVYSSTHRPQYFSFLLPSGAQRQYWLGEDEVTGDIYIFDDDLTTYYFLFLDLAGVLPSKPYIYAQYYVNGSLFTVEKRKVDVETKISMQLKNDRLYVLNIVDGASYTFGEFLTTSITTVTLTLRGIDFPKETLLIYKYVRIYALRGFGTPQGNITVTYQDTLNMTNSVAIDINYRNGTNAYNTTQTTSTFVVSWLNAANDTDYQLIATINHQRYGVYTWKQFFPRAYTTNPWLLGWLGSLPFNINNLIAIGIVLIMGASFSMLNPEIGAFLATVSAMALTLMGWLPPAPGLLMTAFAFSIMFAIIIARRRVQHG